MKYKDLQDKQKHSLFLAILSREKFPWIQDFVRIVFAFIFFPFKNKIRKSHFGAAGYLKKLIKVKRFEEGYIFGLERLSDLKPPKSNSTSGPVYYTTWWSVFQKTCECALELDRDETFSVLSKIIENGPDPKMGFAVSDSYCRLARLACKKNEPKAAWKLVENAIRCDDSYGYAYFLRAWLGQKLHKGKVLDDLISAIKNQPELKDHILQDQTFKKSIHLLKKLNTKQRTESV